MENREISTRLVKENDKAFLVFEFPGNEQRIDLNSDDQSGLRNLFYFIINELFKEKIIFTEPMCDSDFDIMLFKDVAKDYITKLNEEIDSIHAEILKDFQTEDSTNGNNDIKTLN